VQAGLTSIVPQMTKAMFDFVTLPHHRKYWKNGCSESGGPAVWYFSSRLEGPQVVLVPLRSDLPKRRILSYFFFFRTKKELQGV